MSAGAKGLLLVLADPPPSLEEEFNDWYDTEHLPERAALPGFETACRYRGIGDGPAYLATYDLAASSVLESEPYLAVSGANFSPWTLRVTARSHPVRITARQVWPGGALARPCARMMLMRLRDAAEGEAAALAGELRDALSPHGLTQLRIFACREPAPDALLVLAELDGLGGTGREIAGVDSFRARLDLVATYRPYRP